MTDPAGAGTLMLTWLGYIDGIHGAPYIAAPWILWVIIHHLVGGISNVCLWFSIMGWNVCFFLIGFKVHNYLARGGATTISWHPGSRVQGRPATTTCLMVDQVDSAKWGCWRILPTSDWLQFLGLFKIIVYWCLLFIFLWGCKLVAHPATPGPCWIHELLGLGTGCSRPRSRIHEIIGCTLPRGISSTKTTSHAGETDTT